MRGVWVFPPVVDDVAGACFEHEAVAPRLGAAMIKLWCVKVFAEGFAVSYF